MLATLQRERGTEEGGGDQHGERHLVAPLQRVVQQIAPDHAGKDDDHAGEQDQRTGRADENRQQAFGGGQGGQLLTMASTTGLVSGYWSVKLVHSGLTSLASAARSMV